MDNSQTPIRPSGRWPLAGRTTGQALLPIAWGLAVLVACAWAAGQVYADPGVFEGDFVLAAASSAPWASFEDYEPHEMTYYPPSIAGDLSYAESDEDGTCPGDPDASHAYGREPSPYDQYAGHRSRPDRWDFAGPQIPWLEFPGCCDDWRVGPLLSVRTDGLVLYRTNVARTFLTNNLGVMPPYELQHVNRFEHAGGARAYVTSRNDQSYAMQIGYMGAASWNASAESQFRDLANPLQNETRLHTYASSLYSVEMNVLPYSTLNSQLILGMRYVEFDENFTRLTDRINSDINNNNLATGLNDDFRAILIDNRLIGAQIGLRRDIWSKNRRFSLETLLNGGPYCNMVARKDLDQTYVTVNPPDDPDTVADESQQTDVRLGETRRRRSAAELALFGEAALTGVYRFHPCLSIRAGYQAVWLQGAHLASDQFGETSSVFFHGFHCGAEYRR